MSEGVQSEGCTSTSFFLTKENLAFLPVYFLYISMDFVIF